MFLGVCAIPPNHRMGPLRNAKERNYVRDMLTCKTAILASRSELKFAMTATYKHTQQLLRLVYLYDDFDILVLQDIP
jgi:hypothetical protein